MKHYKDSLSHCSPNQPCTHPSVQFPLCCSHVCSTHQELQLCSHVSPNFPARHPCVQVLIFFVTVSSVTRSRAHLITDSSPYTKWAFQAVPSANVTVKLETSQRARKITEISPVPRYTFVGTLSVIFITP